jgi:subtilisin family serine protease
MKVTATKDVHIREGNPLRSKTNLKGVLHKGFSIEVLHTDKNGELIDGNPEWYQDKNKDWYWSGGFYMEDSKTKYNTSEESDNDLTKVLSSLINLPPRAGDKINIAILDSGIDLGHNSIKESVLKPRIKNYQSDTEENHHGTQVAGILTGDDKDIKGLCRNSKLFDLRVATQKGVTVDEAVLNALRDLYNWNADIVSSKNLFCPLINMSLDIQQYNIPEVQLAVNDLASQGVVIVVAGIDGTTINNIATLQNVFPVGAYKKHWFKNFPENGFPAQLCVSFLNEEIISTGLYPDHSPFCDSSAYTALTTGLVAHYLSSAQGLSNLNRIERTKEYLRQIATPIKISLQSPIKFKPYRND